MDECLFCQVIKGEVPTTVVYENEVVLAFEDIQPQMPVHVLIVPKQHFASLSDDIPLDILGQLFSTAKKVAEIKGIKDKGYRVIVNTGDDAQQTVHHLHVHVLGGALMNIGSPAV